MCIDGTAYKEDECADCEIKEAEGQQGADLGRQHLLNTIRENSGVWDRQRKLNSCWLHAVFVLLHCK